MIAAIHYLWSDRSRPPGHLTTHQTSPDSDLLQFVKFVKDKTLYYWSHKHVDKKLVEYPNKTNKIQGI